MALDEINFDKSEISVPCVYFKHPGEKNTRRTMEIAAERAEALKIQDIIVASTFGEAGLLATQIFSGKNIIVVTHSTGFVKPDFQQLSSEQQQKIEDAGAKVLTCQHAMGGINRAVRKKLRTYELDEIIAFTLRLFGQGTKVAIEIALMAADAGLVSTSKPCISIGGTSQGADTAILLKPAHAQDFFDLRIMELLSKPHLSS
jgi:hypothetical protein